ncbi:MAG: hypothetical protein AB7J63_15100 [Vicinamibacterales bacterium]
MLAFGIALVISWPQALHPTQVIDHFDPYFSVWRLGHVAHALTRWPMRLFDGNIFYPAQNTLAYSDATLLEAGIAAPLLWAGLSPTLVYNLVLLGGLLGSGVAMFVLARHLTHATAPALAAVVVFTALPYRVEHIMHLELQWAMFIPLVLWSVHRTVESGRWSYGLMTGLLLWLQFLSCVYYGVFLSLTLAVFVPLLLASTGTGAWRSAAPKLLAGAAIGALLTLPYALRYADAARELGGRHPIEIARYSARAASYLATSRFSWVWGWTADRWGSPELRLFPGLVALALAIAAFWHPRRRIVIVYAVAAAVAVDLSFGPNGVLYGLIVAHAGALQGFRALARFGIIVGCMLAVLAAFGTQAILARLPAGGGGRRAFVPLILAAMVVEYAVKPIPLSYAIEAAPADLYKVLDHADPGPIIEYPLPQPAALPGFDPYFQAWSVWHWRPLLNGYSGFYAPQYLEALPTLVEFPDSRSIALLRDRGVRYVIVHRAFYEPGKYTPLALRIGNTSELRLWGVYKDPLGLADVFEIVPPQSK